MPLDKILSDTGIKRKALIAAPTQCRFCGRQFIDKWFKGDRIHKVRCDKCGLINAEVDMDDWMKAYYQGLRHSIGTYGDLGFHIEGVHFRKVIKEAFDFKTDAEVEAKLHEYEYGVKMKQTQKMIEEERKRRLAERRKNTITIKHKGEESYQLGKKKKEDT